MIKIIWSVLLCLNLCLIVFADDSLKLSGVMNGETPTAIINDKIVAVGDSLDGYRVIEIGVDHVVCQGKGGTLDLHLKESAAPQIKTQTAPVAKPVASKSVIPAQAQPAQITDGPPDLQARQHMDQSLKYLQEGDTLLKSQFVFERLYAKAADLCDDAEREAQAALRSVSAEAMRAGIKDHIDKIYKAKQMIIKEKADFSTRVRSVISAHQVFSGMTQRDVISSWGSPLMQNRDGGVEKWVYQDNNGYQKELVFKDGVLVSF